MGERLPLSEVRTGPAYEADRVADRARLASAAALRRVDLGADLVLVFDTSETVRTALEELLRAERAGGDRVAAEAAAFAELLGDEHDLAATLYVDVADPVALAECLSELSGVEDAVYLEVAGRRVTGRSDPGDGGSGAFHLLFELDGEQRRAVQSGAPITVGIEHPACRTVATLSAGQAGAIGADLPR